MDSYTNGIADTGATLAQLLQKEISDLGDEDVFVYSPGESKEPLPKLSLFLYQVQEDPDYINREPEYKDFYTLTSPSIALELFFMVIANSDSALKTRSQEEHNWIGKAVQVFRNNPVLTDPILVGGLANKGLRIKITMNPVPLDGLTKIWQSFHTRPFKLSVCFRVAPVFIETGVLKPVTSVKKVVLGQK